MEPFIKKLSDVRLSDIASVGGKNASSGEMLATLSATGIRVPDGFTTTAYCFWVFMQRYGLHTALQQLLENLDRKTYSNLKEIGTAARQLILSYDLPLVIKEEITVAYRAFCNTSDIEVSTPVAVRSSATTEDLPESSFAGLHESFLNITGEAAVIEAVHRCFASLYTDRAIKYREDKGFDHNKVAIAVGIQKMVRADKGSAGICFTLEPESGFRDIIHISGIWGLGENIVQGNVLPDEFLVFKPTLLKGKNAIVQRKLGDKTQTMVYATDSEATTMNIPTPEHRQIQFVLSDKEVLLLSKWCIQIEQHYQKPMDIEWAKDGITGELYIIQARPETVHTQRNSSVITQYILQGKSEVLISGSAIGSKVASGTARILHSPAEGDKVKDGDIIVTDTTSPDWEPVLRKASAIITNKGGRTSHASIIARELGVPAIVGCLDATNRIIEGQAITVACCEGKTGNVYKGLLKWQKLEHDFSTLSMPEHSKAMLIISEPEKAFLHALYPNEGVGLLRIEFIINHYIKIHPMALAKFDELKPSPIKDEIAALTKPYPDKRAFFSNQLAQGIGTIAAAFYPKDVIVRLSDFKTNEYANLIGGTTFEPTEENPMIGFRGASRYTHPLYQEAFKLECEAIQKVRNEMGLSNVKVMIPFCRTITEANKVIEEMAKYGIDRNVDKSLSLYLMVEIPANVLLIADFAKLFDGFSIGSNDLTQLTLGVDRNSAIISSLFDEHDQAVETMLSMAIQKANALGVKIGLCGQAPSDDPAFTQFLMGQGINSISFNPDALLQGIAYMKKAEYNTQLIS